MIWKIIFCVSVIALFYSYLIYPFILTIASRSKRGNQEFYSDRQSFPGVTILLAIFNEEDVLEEKLKSLFSLIYPEDKLEILVGSDASTDKTNNILKSIAFENEILKYEIFKKRTGKVKIINKLASKARGEILVITDANIFHNPDSLKMLVRNFKNEKVGLVDSVMSHTGLDHSGISIQETTYVQRESRIKKMEGMLWGSMMGPSGGFYAIRQHLFHPVPKNFLVDDFYINMKVLENRYWSICEPLSIVTEDVSNNWIEDFKRKMRISAGNFQNLRIFAYFLLRVFQPVGFCFLSHKVLRWFGPFFLLLALISSAMNYKEAFFMILFYAQIILLIIPIFDHILRKIKIHIVILRFVSHFYNTNLAILLGFFWFLKGIKTNVWQPTKRNQSQ